MMRSQPIGMAPSAQTTAARPMGGNMSSSSIQGGYPQGGMAPQGGMGMGGSYPQQMGAGFGAPQYPPQYPPRGTGF